jgi:hypothetical protein
VRRLQKGLLARHHVAVRLLTEAALLLAIGLFLGFIAPFGTAMEQPLPRYVFWIAVILAGGTLGAVVGAALRRQIRNEWIAVIATSSLTALPIATLVLLAMILVLGHEHDLFSRTTVALAGEVLVISLFVEVLRTLARRPSKPVVETRTIVAPPLPAAEAKFRERLSARLRSARLLAIEAHDHYVRVHTDAGVELITARFADAVSELSAAHGFRVHRSWWVAGSAIKSARWGRARGELELEGGLAVPVSRSGAPLLRAAGWL